ncbi:hypothetical protein Q5752_006048 [Cryptotrichosporon argae]
MAYRAYAEHSVAALAAPAPALSPRTHATPYADTPTAPMAPYTDASPPPTPALAARPTRTPLNPAHTPSRVPIPSRVLTSSSPGLSAPTSPPKYSLPPSYASPSAPPEYALALPTDETALLWSHGTGAHAACPRCAWYGLEGGGGVGTCVCRRADWIVRALVALNILVWSAVAYCYLFDARPAPPFTVVVERDHMLALCGFGDC